MKSMDRRLSALEGAKSRDEIPVYAEEEADVPAAIEAMIAAGEITEADRPRCIWWLLAKGRPGEHEEALKELR